MSHHYQFRNDRFCDLICTLCVFSNILKLPASKSGICLEKKITPLSETIT